MRLQSSFMNAFQTFGTLSMAYQRKAEQNLKDLQKAREMQRQKIEGVKIRFGNDESKLSDLNPNLKHKIMEAITNGK